MEILRHLDWGFKHNNVQLRLQIEHIEVVDRQASAERKSRFFHFLE